MSAAPSIRRAAAVMGVCFVMLVLVFAVLSASGKPPSLVWLSALTSVFAVLLPALVAFFWPRDGAPAELPYRPVSAWMLVGAACCSLPLYAVLAAVQVAIGMHMRVPAPAGTASMLAASGGFAFVGIWVAIAALPALAEELLFRGLIQQATVARLGTIWGIVTAAALFAFVHGEVVGFVPRLLMGLWFGYLFWRTSSLWTSTCAHMLNNTWGLVVANLGVAVEQHLGGVSLVSAVALAAGAAAFHKAGLWREPTATVPAAPDHALPRVIPLARPESPRTERPAEDRGN